MGKKIIVKLMLIAIATSFPIFEANYIANGQLKPAFKKEEKVRDYQGSWVKIPNIKGSLINGEMQTIKHKQGFVSVIFFLASWCIPCQNFTPKMKALEKEFSNLRVRFKYIFNHDLQTDMRGFIRSHKISEDHALLAANNTLLDFRDPTLPAIFVADKHGWIVKRMLGTKEKSLDAEALQKAIDYLVLK